MAFIENMPGYQQWREINGHGTMSQYVDWLSQAGYSSPQDFASRGLAPGGGLNNPLTGQPYPIPSGFSVPGQPAPSPPGGGLTQIPTAPTGPPGYAPPPVSMPPPLPNPTPQGLGGGMPMIRDRMMGATMAPFAQPNWGVPQVPQQYLTSQQPLPGGSVAGIGQQRSFTAPWLREVAIRGGGLGGLGATQPQVGMANPQAGIGPATRPATPQEMVGLGRIPGLRIPRKVPQGMGSR